MENKPKDKEIKDAIDRQIKMLESGGMVKFGKKRNPARENSPVTLTADKVIAARNRYLGEKNLYNWKISRFLIPNYTELEYNYDADGILETPEYKKMQAENA